MLDSSSCWSPRSLWSFFTQSLKRKKKLCCQTSWFQNVTKWIKQNILYTYTKEKNYSTYTYNKHNPYILMLFCFKTQKQTRGSREPESLIWHDIYISFFLCKNSLVKSHWSFSAGYSKEQLYQLSMNSVSCFWDD